MQSWKRKHSQTYFYLFKSFLLSKSIYLKKVKFSTTFQSHLNHISPTIHLPECDNTPQCIMLAENHQIEPFPALRLQIMLALHLLYHLPSSSCFFTLFVETKKKETFKFPPKGVLTVWWRSSTDPGSPSRAAAQCRASGARFRRC